MPMALVSSIIKCRRASNLAPAPETVKARSSPQEGEHRRFNSAKTCASCLGIFRPATDSDAPADFDEDQHAEKQTARERETVKCVVHVTFSRSVEGRVLKREWRGKSESPVTCVTSLNTRHSSPGPHHLFTGGNGGNRDLFKPPLTLFAPVKLNFSSLDPRHSSIPVMPALPQVVEFPAREQR